MADAQDSDSCPLSGGVGSSPIFRSLNLLNFKGFYFFLCCILCCISFLTTVCFTSIKFLCLIIIKNNINYLTVFYFKINPYFTKVLSFGVIFRWAWNGKRYRNSVTAIRQRGTAINFCKITCKIFISAGRNSI